MNRVLQHPALRVLAAFATWRAILFVIAVAAPLFFVRQPVFTYPEAKLPSEHRVLWWQSWANFDGIHYLEIANRGYRAVGFIQAFFPVYPLFIAALSSLLGNTFLSAVIVANGAAAPRGCHCD